MKIIKRILAGCLALTLMLSALPTIAAKSGATSYTKVESKLDFTGMPVYGEGRNDAQTAEKKEQVRQTLLAAGAVECENLFLKGNMETIVNPGGYRGAGYYIQKVTAAEGETIQDATLNFGYWLTTNSTQGYIEVYVSADNVQYEKIYEQREGNGAAFMNSRREETIELPFAENQTEIYVKFVMEHWDTYEGAGIAYSTLTINASQNMPEDPGTSPDEYTKVQNTYSFDALSAGEVTAEDIGAIEESNLYYNLDGVGLLSPRNGYEKASATWLLEAAEGETLNDCGLTIVGRTCYSVESVKDDHYLKVYASTDGISYTLVKDFRANDNPDDNQEFPVDLTDVVKGSEKAYVKLEWLVFDSPHIFGIRSVTLTGNAASEEPETPTEPETTVTKVESKLDFTGMTTYGEGKNDAETAQNKEKVRQTLLAAGAVECENLFLKGNMETIVNPGGYRNPGYYIQKVTAAEGETIQDATLNFGYWLTTNSTQGYIEVYVSADNAQYEKIYEQREGNGPAFANSRREETIELPFAEDQTEIYVKFVMEHWDTYEGAGIAYSTLTINASQDTPDDPYTSVQNTYSFDTLPSGEVTAEDIGAIEESNLYYNLDGVGLLSPRNGYEEASATWLLEAAEGETLNDCGLTIVGRTCYSVESVKDDHYLKVYASTDGISYTLVKDFRANGNPDDNQEFPVDLTDVVKGSEKAYVKLEWLVFDSPHIFGIRSVTLTGNADAQVDDEGSDPSLDFDKAPEDCKLIKHTYIFDKLPKGEVNAGAIGAIYESNMYFGIDGVPLLSPRNGYEIASATWLLEAAEGEPLHNCLINIVGRTFYITENVKNDNYLKVFASPDGKNYTLVKEFRANSNPDFSQNFLVDLSEAVKGSGKAYIKLEWLVFDSPHIFGIRGITLVGNSIGKNVSFGIGGTGQKKPVDLSIPHEECMKVELSQNFNTLTAGEVTAEDLGAVDEMNMFFGIDGVPLLSPRNGYEIASATWKLETEGKDPLYDCVLTIVGRTFYVTESVKDDNYLKVYASTDGVNYTLVKDFRSNDNPDDTQRFTVDLTDVVKGNGQAYVKLEWLVFDSPHIFGIRSVTLTGNTAGIDNSSGASAKVAITNIQNFSQLPVGPADKDALLAYKSANLYYGYNNIGLLTASEAGEDAYVTWVLNAKEGEPFEDCYLTLVARCGYINQELAGKSELSVQFSSDGENYSTVTTLKPTEPAGDLQSFLIDLSAQSFGLNKIYVRLYWKSQDDPSGIGLRAMSLVANAGEDYELFTPNVLSDKLTIEINDTVDSVDAPVEPQPKEEENNGLVWIIAGGAAAAVVIAAIVVILLKKKRSRKKADKKDASI